MADARRVGIIPARASLCRRPQPGRRGSRGVRESLRDPSGSLRARERVRRLAMGRIRAGRAQTVRQIRSTRVGSLSGKGNSRARRLVWPSRHPHVRADGSCRSFVPADLRRLINSETAAPSDAHAGCSRPSGGVPWLAHCHENQQVAVILARGSEVDLGRDVRGRSGKARGSRGEAGSCGCGRRREGARRRYA